MILCIDTGIWKVTMEGSLGVALSKSKAIMRMSAESTIPNAEIKAFRCFGHDCSTSEADMAAGDWAKSSTML